MARVARWVDDVVVLSPQRHVQRATIVLGLGADTHHRCCGRSTSAFASRTQPLARRAPLSPRASAGGGGQVAAVQPSGNGPHNECIPGLGHNQNIEQLPRPVEHVVPNIPPPVAPVLNIPPDADAEQMAQANALFEQQIRAYNLQRTVYQDAQKQYQLDLSHYIDKRNTWREESRPNFEPALKWVETARDTKLVQGEDEVRPHPCPIMSASNPTL